MENIFTISFGKSSSANYQNAIELSKKFDNFTELNGTNEKHTIITNSAEVKNKFQIFENLYNLINNWKSTIIKLNGDTVDNFNFFYKYNEIIKCSLEYEKSTNKDIFCNISQQHEGWGCKHLKDIKRHLDNYYYGTYWYKYGSFENEKKWKINKTLIKEKLYIEIKDKKIDLCPYFYLNKIDKLVEELPDFIDLENQNLWMIDYVEDFKGSLIVKIPKDINHIESNNSNKKLSFSFNTPNLISSINLNDSENIKNRKIPKVTFDEIGGIEEIIDQVREIIELPLKQPKLYEHLGIKPHKGILLYGQPGNGKTLIAKAIANEVSAHFISVSGPELLNKYYGQSEENLRNVFIEAGEMQPSIIFFDEIDSIASRRSNDENNRIESKFVNQLLTLMDGIIIYENVIVIASTNRPELLDEALLRPGRFDFKIEVKKPNEKGILKIIEVYTKKMPLDSQINLIKIANKMIGFSGAEIAFVIKDAAINSLKRNIDIKSLILEENEINFDLNLIKINENDFDKAIDTFIKNNNLNYNLQNI